MLRLNIDFFLKFIKRRAKLNYFFWKQNIKYKFYAFFPIRTYIIILETYTDVYVCKKVSNIHLEARTKT